MSKIENIAKNTSYLTFALVVQKIISFSYFTFLARYVGPTNLGEYYLAISFTTIFAIFIDLGLANVITREVAKDKDKTETWLGNVLTLKIPLALISLLALIIIVHLFNYNRLTYVLVYVSSISMILDSFTVTFFSVIRAHHNLKYESIAGVSYQLIVLIFGYGALVLTHSLIAAISALVLASSFNFFYSYFSLRNKLKVRIHFLYDKELLKKILIITWPFAVYAILQRLYTYLDVVLLSVLSNTTQVGLYQVAFKIIFALQFLPAAFIASLYPALSVYWKNHDKQLQITFERALNYLIIIVLPLIVGAIVLSDQIILLFKSAYGGSIWPLRISIISLFFIFLNFPIGALLNACDQQRRNTINMAIVTISSIMINLAFIPHWQAIGASVTVLVSNALMFILGLYYIQKTVNYHFYKNLIILLKVFLSSSIMGIIVMLGKNYLNIFIIAALGGVLYFYLLFLLGGFKKRDINSIYKLFSKLKL